MNKSSELRVRTSARKIKWAFAGLVVLLLSMGLVLLSEHHRAALRNAENSAMIPELGRFNLQFVVEKGIPQDDYLGAFGQFAEQHRGSSLIEDYHASVRDSAAEKKHEVKEQPR